MSHHRFQLTEQHLKLLRAMSAFAGWDEDFEWGAPVFNTKRPYGNSSGVERDVAEVLGVEPADGRSFSDQERAALLKLHRETFPALLVVLSTGQSEPGWYESEAEWNRQPTDWRRVGS